MLTSGMFPTGSDCPHQQRAWQVLNVTADPAGMVEDFSATSEVDCIRVKPVSYNDNEYDTVLMSCSKAPAPFHHNFTDTTVVVEGQAFQVHKAVLANSSPVFERMFSSAMLEGTALSFLSAA